MAIQTQGFQFQNLARYTPVDPTLVGVDFSRIGSGIADAMKLGSSLQQYQMRKQAMEEEAATRQSRIDQANAVARLNAARATEALTNVTLMEEQIAQAARTAKERDKQIEASGILRFGPEADVARARATIALTPEQTALNLRQIQGELATLPLTEEARKIALARQIAADRSGILTDEQVKNMSMQQMVLGLAAGGLKLSHEQAQIYNTEADTRLKNAQALAAAAGKSDNPLPIWKEFNDQINLLETRGVPDSNNTLTNLLVYEGRMAARARGEKEGIFRSEIKTDPILDKRLEELNKLRKLRDDYAPGAGGKRSISSGGLSGGGMAAVTPPALGEVPAAAIAALAEIANLGVTTPSAGVVAAAPALAQLFSGGGQAVPAAAAPAPAAPAVPTPAATMEIKDGKVVPVKTSMQQAEDVTKKAIEFAKENPAATLAIASQAPRVVKPALRMSGAALNALKSAAPEILKGTKLVGNRAVPGLALNEILRSAISTDQTAKEAADMSGAGEFASRLASISGMVGAGQNTALGRAFRKMAQNIYDPASNPQATDYEAAKRIEDEIDDISYELGNILQSNLTTVEKINQRRPLMDRMNELIALKNANTARPMVSRSGSAVVFPGITFTAPESATKATQVAEGTESAELTGPLVPSNRSVGPIRVIDLETVLRERPAGPFSEDEIRAINKARVEGTLPAIAYDENVRLDFIRRNAPQILDRLPVIGR